MNARDEIAALAAQIDHEINDLYSPGDDVMGEDLAVLLHAAGYRKPRTITTVEELDALGFGAAVLNADNAVMVNDGDPEGGNWVSLAEDIHNGGPLWFDAGDVNLPATVLHEPTPGGAA